MYVSYPFSDLNYNHIYIYEMYEHIYTEDKPIYSLKVKEWA